MDTISASIKVQQDGHTLGAMFLYWKQIYRLETFLPGDRMIGRAMVEEAEHLFIEIPFYDAEWINYY